MIAMNEVDLKPVFRNFVARDVDFKITDPFLKQISIIPHLKLNIHIDLQRLRNDFNFLDNKFAPYELSHPDEQPTVYWPRWAGRYLVNWVPFSTALVGTQYYHDTENIMKKYYPDYQNDFSSKWDFIHYKTEIYDSMIYTKYLLEEVIGTENHYRAAIMKVPKGEHIPWHTHNNFLFENNDAFEHKTSVIHFPIYTTKECLMLSKTPDQRVHAVHYAEGEAWMLQEYFDHGVDNIDGKDRYHFIVHVKLQGNVKKIIEDSL